LSSIYNKTVFE